MKHFIRNTTSRQDSSSKADVQRDSHLGPGAARWPIDVKVAGVRLSMTDAGARELIEKLQRAVEVRS